MNKYFFAGLFFCVSNGIAMDKHADQEALKIIDLSQIKSVTYAKFEGKNYAEGDAYFAELVTDKIRDTIEADLFTEIPTVVVSRFIVSGSISHNGVWSQLPHIYIHLDKKYYDILKNLYEEKFKK